MPLDDRRLTSGGESPTRPRSLRARERQREALQLRIAGWTFEQIGSHLTISRQAAHRLVARALGDISTQIKEEADHLRARQLAEIGAVKEALLPAATRGDTKAAQTLARLWEREAHLAGLDVQPGVKDGPTVIVIDPRLADGSLPPGADVVEGEVIEEQPALLERGDEADR